MTAVRSASLPYPPASGGQPPPSMFAVTSGGGGADSSAQLGREAYSYTYVYRAFRPLLERLGDVVEVERPESRLDYAVRRAWERGQSVTHLSFLPLHRIYLTSMAPNVAFPFWEFPDLPDEDLDGNPRNNWVRVAGRLSVIVCASRFTRDAFVRAGVRTPVHVVPVPVPADYFAVPIRRAGERSRLDCAAHVLPLEGSAGAAASRLSRARTWARTVYELQMQPRMPAAVDRALGAGVRVARAYQAEYRAARMPPANRAALELSGVVYTAFVNPFDARKNWQDLLSAFVIALRAADDATLVLKLVVCPTLAAAGLRSIVDHYRSLGLEHRCKVVCVTAYLSTAQMLALARGSTYALSASRAESACLPMQDFLAAARPAVAPAHSALAEYLDAEVGFPVASHPEPASWPHDTSGRLTTSWHRIVWQSLHDQIEASYRVATRERDRYERLADNARARMRALASAEHVWPRLCAALDRDGTAAAVR